MSEKVEKVDREHEDACPVAGIRKPRQPRSFERFHFRAIPTHGKKAH
jgi:hypothetical protein